MVDFTYAARRGALIATAILGVAGPVALVVMPRPGQNVLVISGIAGSPEHVMAVVAQAGGALVSVNAAGTTAVAAPQAADFIPRLYAAGAFIVLDAAAVGGCFSRLTQLSRQVLS
jgi:hypothetical protein